MFEGKKCPLKTKALLVKWDKLATKKQHWHKTTLVSKNIKKRPGGFLEGEISGVLLGYTMLKITPTVSRNIDKEYKIDLNSLKYRGEVITTKLNKTTGPLKKLPKILPRPVSMTIKWLYIFIMVRKFMMTLTTKHFTRNLNLFTINPV